VIDMPVRRYSTLTARFTLAAVFGLAASYKLLHWGAFMRTLAATNVTAWLPVSLRGLVGGGLVGVEVCLVLLFSTGRHGRLAAAGAFVFLVAGTCALLFNLNDMQRSCGCMWNLGGIVPDTQRVVLARNSVLMAAALLMIWHESGGFSEGTRGAAERARTVRCASWPRSVVWTLGLSGVVTLLFALVPARHDGLTLAGWVRRLDAEDESTQLRALARLADIGGRASPAAPRLVQLLRSERAYIRQSAAVALGEIGSGAHEAEPVLQGLLADDIEGVRIAASWALGRIGSDGHTALALHDLAQTDSSARVRARAAQAAQLVEARRR